jgi:hypothetical protein
VHPPRAHRRRPPHLESLNLDLVGSNLEGDDDRCVAVFAVWQRLNAAVRPEDGEGSELGQEARAETSLARSAHPHQEP